MLLSMWLAGAMDLKMAAGRPASAGWMRHHPCIIMPAKPGTKLDCAAPRRRRNLSMARSTARQQPGLAARECRFRVQTDPGESANARAAPLNARSAYASGNTTSPVRPATAHKDYVDKWNKGAPFCRTGRSGTTIGSNSSSAFSRLRSVARFVRGPA